MVLGLEKTRSGYNSVVRHLIRRTIAGIGLIAAMIGATGYLGMTTATGFIPQEDQGTVYVNEPAGRGCPAAYGQR